MFEILVIIIALTCFAFTPMGKAVLRLLQAKLLTSGGEQVEQDDRLIQELRRVHQETRLELIEAHSRQSALLLQTVGELSRALGRLEGRLGGGAAQASNDTGSNGKASEVTRMMIDGGGETNGHAQGFVRRLLRLSRKVDVNRK